MKKSIVYMFYFFCLIITCKAQKSVTWKDLDASVSQHLQKMQYKTTLDTSLNIFYIRANNIKTKLPAIIFIHGGAWVGGTANTFFGYAAYFSLRGLIGISIEYRLIVNEQSNIIHCIEDCKSAIRFIKQHANELNVDTGKIILCGESAGGHLAACMALLNEYNDKNDDTTIGAMPQALVLLNPVVNVATNNFIKYMDASLVSSRKILPDSSILAAKYLQSAQNISPLFQVKKALPPTLLITGLDDKITPPNYAIAFVNAANNFKQNCKLILLPNTGHAFAVPRYKSSEAEIIRTVEQVDGFLTKLGFIKGKPMLVTGYETEWIPKKH